MKSKEHDFAEKKLLAAGMILFQDIYANLGLMSVEGSVLFKWNNFSFEKSWNWFCNFVILYTIL